MQRLESDSVAQPFVELDPAPENSVYSSPETVSAAPCIQPYSSAVLCSSAGSDDAVFVAVNSIRSGRNPVVTVFVPVEVGASTIPASMFVIDSVAAVSTVSVVSTLSPLLLYAVTA